MPTVNDPVLATAARVNTYRSVSRLEVNSPEWVEQAILEGRFYTAVTLTVDPGGAAPFSQLYLQTGGANSFSKIRIARIWVMDIAATARTISVEIENQQLAAGTDIQSQNFDMTGPQLPSGGQVQAEYAAPLTAAGSPVVIAKFPVTSGGVYIYQPVGGIVLRQGWGCILLASAANALSCGFEFSVE